MVAPSVLYGHVAIAIAAAELGRKQEAAEAVRRILNIDPLFGDCVVRDLESRNLHQDLTARVLEGLRKAGMPAAISKASRHPVRRLDVCFWAQARFALAIEIGREAVIHACGRGFRGAS